MMLVRSVSKNYFAVWWQTNHGNILWYPCLFVLQNCISNHTRPMKVHFYCSHTTFMVFVLPGSPLSTIEIDRRLYHHHVSVSEHIDEDDLECWKHAWEYELCIINEDWVGNKKFGKPTDLTMFYALSHLERSLKFQMLIRAPIIYRQRDHLLGAGNWSSCRNNILCSDGCESAKACPGKMLSPIKSRSTLLAVEEKNEGLSKSNWLRFSIENVSAVVLDGYVS